MAPPRKPTARREVLHLRVSTAELARWKRAAKRIGVSLQELVRRGADLEAEGIAQTKEGPPLVNVTHWQPLPEPPEKEGAWSKS